MNNDFPFNPSQFDTIKKALEKKIHVTSSNHGHITLTYNGLGEFKKIAINCDLTTVDKAELEQDILNLFDYAKNQAQSDMTSIILESNDGFASLASVECDNDGDPDEDVDDLIIPGERRDVS